MDANTIIFYTDDDIDDQDIFIETLSSLGKDSHIYIQHDGEELIDALKYHEVMPDIIFLDLNMPRKTGFEVLAEIRSMPQFAGTPVVVLTTAGDPVSADRARKMGANLYVTKPQLYKDFKEILTFIMKIDWGKQPPDAGKFYINMNS